MNGLNLNLVVKKWLTRQGFELAFVQNKTITYSDGDGEGVVTDSVCNANLNHYAYIQNNTENQLKILVTKSVCAYGQSQEQILAAKRSRRPDKGGEIVEQATVCPAGTWHFKMPRRWYTLRALETPREQGGGDETIMGNNDRVPSVTNYVQLAESNCRAGQIVVLLANTSRNGCIDATTYNANEIKIVKSDIVQTGRDPLA